MNDAPWFLEAKARYLGSLREKGERLRVLFEAYEEAPDSNERREELRSAFHRIHGSAGSYGQDELGALCGRCEEELIRLGSTGTASKEDLARLSEAIREFCELAEKGNTDG